MVTNIIKFFKKGLKEIPITHTHKNTVAYYLKSRDFCSLKNSPGHSDRFLHQHQLLPYLTKNHGGKLKKKQSMKNTVYNVLCNIQLGAQPKTK